MDALCAHALWDDRLEYNMLTTAPYLSKLTSLDARQQVEQQLQSAVSKSHEEDIKYVPHINEHYPKALSATICSIVLLGTGPILVGSGRKIK